MTVQWYKDGVPFRASRLYESADNLTDSQEFPVAQPSDTGVYSVVATNPCGSTTNRQDALLNHVTGEYYMTGRFQVGPSVDAQPEPSTLPICSGFSGLPLFSVRADGVGNVNYQWRPDGRPLTNGVDFSETTGRRLRINRPLLYKDEGNYDVVVWDECGLQNAVTSRVATLTLTPGPEWVFRSTNGPAARFQPTMVYDSARRVSVLFGGYFNSPTNSGASTMFGSGMVRVGRFGRPMAGRMGGHSTRRPDFGARIIRRRSAVVNTRWLTIRAAGGQ